MVNRKPKKMKAVKEGKMRNQKKLSRRQITKLLKKLSEKEINITQQADTIRL